MLLDVTPDRVVCWDQRERIVILAMRQARRIVTFACFAG